MIDVGLIGWVVWKEAEAAAEAARLAQIEEAKAQAVNKCGFCKQGLLGKLSDHFERLEYHYCSTTCVAKHRQQLEGS